MLFEQVVSHHLGVCRCTVLASRLFGGYFWNLVAKRLFLNHSEPCVFDFFACLLSVACFLRSFGIINRVFFVSNFNWNILHNYCTLCSLVNCCWKLTLSTNNDPYKLRSFDSPIDLCRLVCVNKQVSAPQPSNPTDSGLIVTLTVIWSSSGPLFAQARARISHFSLVRFAAKNRTMNC